MMRIGKFAKTNKLTIDTIRHYMDLGLIVPEKKGGQYFFDEHCQNDLEHILSFKDMGFSLSEIKKIFYYKKFGKLTEYEKNIYYQSLFKNKYDSINQEIKDLVEKREKLKETLEELSSKSEPSNSVMGVDLKILDILKCLKCSGKLILQNGTINQNQVINGKLTCNCGEEYLIESGILIVGEPYKISAELPLENFILDYINITDSAYLENIHKLGEWSKKKLVQLDLSNKVLLELGSGVGFFLRNVYQELPDDCLYIAVDRNMQLHRFLKSVLEKTGIKKNILFICSDFLNTPILDYSVDIVIDLSGTSNYSLEHEEFLLHELDSVFKPECYLLGSFIAFKNFSYKSKIEAKFRDNFKVEKIKDNLNRLKFSILDEIISDYIENGGKYENYFVQGEKIYTYSFLGKR